jgi:SAM-dependent methyltransferase
MMKMKKTLAIYSTLAQWWPLLSHPKDYEEEAKIYTDILIRNCHSLNHVLELGSGGGNNASHLKKHFAMTLVDLSPQMLEVSKKLNPECEHIVGDMKDIRLNQQFDAVFVHDAINYMTTEEDLFKAIQNCARHCRSGGVVLIIPDHYKETFKSSTWHGGHDSDGKGARYLDWTYDPDPTDSLYTSLMIYVIRDGYNPMIVESDQHICGLFSQETWLRLFQTAGLKPEVIPLPHGQTDHQEIRLAILGEKI